MSHYRHVKICIRSRCQGNKLEICNLFQFIILSHKPWLNAIVESCWQVKLKRWSWKWKIFVKMDVVALISPCSRQFSEALILENLRNCMELSHGELDLVILANIQAFTYVEVSGEKRKLQNWIHSFMVVKVFWQVHVSFPTMHLNRATSIAIWKGRGFFE